MRQEPTILLTPEGWRRLPAELAALRRQRDALLRDYVQDREAESDAVSHAQLRSEIELLDSQIAELTAALQQALPAGPADHPPGTVGLGSRVTVRWDDGEEATYTIVGPLEVDPRAHRISYESPVGQALLGRRATEWIEVATPARQQRLLIVAVMDPPPAGGTSYRPHADEREGM